MSISTKIQKEINNLDITNNEKQLLLTLLEHEDKSVHQYKKEYVKIVKEYLKELDGEEE